MIHRVSAIAFILLLLMSGCSNREETHPVTGLVERIAPQFADDIVFEHMESPSGQDLFELESTGRGKILIRGNNAISMAMGFNHYLKYYCMTSVSWYADQPVQLPEAMPEVPEKIRKEAKVEKRFFLNYCTFGYTMPWWQWRDWERLIDWMALNGINMPLAITGQESVWYKVWKDFGLSDQQIREFFTGPAHLPFNRMSVLDRWGGPLPHSYMDHQLELQKRILERERIMGMTPILQAFSGHVPEALNSIFPDANIAKLGEWAGFDESYSCSMIDAGDSLFNRIQKAYLEEMIKQFGTDHIYGADPFVEVQPLSWELDYLANLSNTIYSSMAEADPEASWLQMAWVFYYDRANWTKERIKAYLTAVPQDKMILLDYYCEYTEIWQKTESFFQQPYIWCYLGNFGGNTMLAGNIEEVDRRINNALKNGGENLIGIGSTLEALNVNPVVYEYVFEKVWESDSTDVNEWMGLWADRRTGYKDENVRKAWKILLDEVYQYPHPPYTGQATLTNARPTLTGHGNWSTNPQIHYSNKELFHAWELMLNAKDRSRDSYGYDVVNVGRQVIGNHFLELRDQFNSHYNSKNLNSLRITGTMMKELFNDLERMLATRPSFLLGDWLEDARKFGVDSAEAAYYEKNARNIITTWGGAAHPLNDYANRNMAGLMDTYYGRRWEMFIDDVIASVEKGEQFDEKAFFEEVTKFEFDWVDGTEKYLRQPVGNSVAIAEQLMKKYKTQIIALN